MSRRSTARPTGARAVLTGVLLTVQIAAAAQTADMFVIRDIRVEGLQRIDAGSVFGTLPLRVGDVYDADKGVVAIRALFGTGQFKDVRLELDGDALVVVLDERPAIAAVEFNGLKEFDKDAVLRSLREVGLAPGRSFDRGLLQRSENELRRQYLGRGFYAMTLTTTVTPVERNRVNISVNIEEGQAAGIRRIRFTGNSAFPDAPLRDEMQLAESGWFTWYTKRDLYSREKLAGDLEALRSFYLNRGYVDFQVLSSPVAISADKSEVHITINVHEGERFRVSEVRLEGELLGLRNELAAAIDVTPGAIYSAERMNQIGRRITERLGTLGYAFATVDAVPEPDRAGGAVAVTLLVDPRRRAYVRRVNIGGNTRTRDEVIRREVRSVEAGIFDADKVRLSRDRIDRLGYFEKVQIDTPPVPGANDQIDVNISVKERPTGSVQAGAGYSSTDKLVLQGSITQQNLFGTGQAVALEINTSRATQTYSVSHTEPYATQDGISRTVDLADSRSDLARLGRGSVDLRTRRAGTAFGLPLSELDRVFIGLRAERSDIGVTRCPLDYTDPNNPIAQADCTPSPTQYIDYVDSYGEHPTSVLATLGWGRDSRDNLIAPTRGRLHRLNIEAALPVYDLRYHRTTYQFQEYLPLFGRLTLAYGGQLGFGGGYEGKPYPVFKNFFAGGLGSVRGFENNSLGPRDANGNAVGGTRQLSSAIELLVPLPGADRSLRALAFVDGGQVWAEGQRVALNELRFAGGLGVAWISPLGPLKLSYALPLRYWSFDRFQRFQFQIGTAF
jgi:outer membrane protein insertion porin family